MTTTRAGLVLLIAGALAVCPAAASAQTFNAVCPTGLDTRAGSRCACAPACAIPPGTRAS